MGKTIAHFWPEFGAWLGGLEDTRDQTRITYSRQFCPTCLLASTLTCED